MQQVAHFQLGDALTKVVGEPRAVEARQQRVDVRCRKIVERHDAFVDELHN